MDDRQLHWVHRNRRPRPDATSLGPVLRSVTESQRVSGPPWKWKLVAMLDQKGAGELLDRVEVGEIRRGVLFFEVGEPAWAAHLRLMWEQRLLSLIRPEFPMIREVRFRVRPAPRRS